MNLETTVALLMASLIGVALGLLGSGGTMITLPVLVYVAGVPVSQAVAMALVVVGGTSLAGSVLQYRRGHFDVRVALLFAVTGMIGAYGGARLTHLFSPPVLLTVFSAIMVGVGVKLFRDRHDARQAAAQGPARCALIGALVGVLTGFLGIGGGFLIVPALMLFGGLDIKKATGTSLAVIALNSLSGLAGQLRYVQFDWWMALAFLAAATAGMAGGVAAKGRLSEGAIRKTFAGFVLAVGLAMAWQNVAALIR
ncbi:MAG: sulfite exporter TauE/SafE family protein [Verrucomicrobia bacterium]|nr:sulfite exporter TauE/SafE family protein [Verrucomicrobiota bacterium]